VTGYADPELLITEWMRDTIGGKFWTSYHLPPNERYVAPLTHVLRDISPNDLPLTLDDVLLDANTYAADEDRCKAVSLDIWNAMVFKLPGTVFGNGVLVKHCRATPPIWAPDPSVYRRTAAYRVILHGVI